AGVTYTYTVRCVTADGAAFAGGYDTAGLTISYVAVPVLTGVSNTARGVTVEWNAVDGAERYWVYRKVSGGSWKRVGTTSATSYTDTTAEAGVTYAYTVRCVSADGTVFTSGYDNEGLSICAQ
ncbi:MAG: fibronectin type III domain-containing protein, partial [Clostridiales bacterium]|nr:fibronectin type III domain-containing protein [Clostridiales bacterium]